MRRMVVGAVALLSVLGMSGVVAAGTSSTQPTRVMASSYVDPALNVPPPPGFDPLTATSGELAKYHFPARPTHLQALQSWTQAMEHAKHYVPPNPVPVALWFGPDTNNNWAGYVDTSSTGSMTEATTAFTVPLVSPDASTLGNWPVASFWTGMGGFTTQEVVQAGVAAIGSWPTSQYKFWTEDYPESVVWEGPAISPNQLAYIDVTRTGGDATYWLENESTGYYQVFTTAAPYQDGTSAEWIVEQAGAYLPNFGYVNNPTAEYNGYEPLSWDSPIAQTMISNGVVQATVTGITNNEHFDYVWEHQ